MEKKSASIFINNREIGEGCPTYIVAEMSANHNQDFERAVKIVESARAAGADALKVQTYTPDTITIDCDADYFQIRDTIWGKQSLHGLYKQAYTPWEWQPKLQKAANDLGMDFFSSPFDPTSVDFLEKMNVPAYKVASFEVVDIPLVRKMAKTGKPIIVSTGMATFAEINEVVQTIRENDVGGLALLKCTSAYPAPPEEINLRTIPHMAQAFDLPVGLSDHTMGGAVAVAAVAIGACIVEKHFTLSRADSGTDSAFSMEPDEFAKMVRDIRQVEKSLGQVDYEITKSQIGMRKYRRSLFVVRDIKAGEVISEDNVRSIRPGNGLHPRHMGDVLGRKAARDIPRGTPLSWEHLLL